MYPTSRALRSFNSSAAIPPLPHLFRTLLTPTATPIPAAASRGLEPRATARELPASTPRPKPVHAPAIEISPFLATPPPPHPPNSLDTTRYPQNSKSPLRLPVPRAFPFPLEGAPS